MSSVSSWRHRSARLLLPLAILSHSALAGVAQGIPRFSAEFLVTSLPPTYKPFELDDVDGDGLPDLLVTHPLSDGIAILRGRGDGTFGTLSLVTTGDAPYCFVLGDLNEDGRKDLITMHLRSEPNGYQLSVRIGNGDATFGPKKVFPGIGNYVSMALGDLNGDGHLDLVMTLGWDTVATLRGDGHGNLVWVGEHFIDGTGKDVALADFDGDGHLDAAVGNAGSLRVSVLRGKGDCTFWPRTDFHVNNGQEAVTAGDVNRDGLMDIVTTGPNAHSIAVLIGNGDGTFDPWIDYATAQFPWDVHLADIDLDGDLDAIVANESISVLLGRGDGTFEAWSRYGRGGALTVASGDVDVDGRPDVVALGPEAQAFLGNGDGTFGRSLATPHGVSAIAAADLDGDGKDDLLSANYSSQNVSVMLHRPNGFVRTDYAVGGSPRGVAVADFDRDGQLDLAAANSFTRRIAVLRGTGNGSFAAATSHGTPGHSTSLVTADLNADGFADLAVTDGSANRVFILRGRGDGSFENETALPTANGPTGLAVGDLNDDEALDLVVCESGDASFPDPYPDFWDPGTQVSVFFGLGDGTYQPRIDYNVGLRPMSAQVVDLNRDGHADVAVANWDEGLVSVLLNQGDGSLGAAQFWDAGTRAMALIAADLDADGTVDLAVADHEASAVQVMAGRGDGTFESPISFGTRPTPVALALCRLDDDDRPDLVTANWQSNRVSLLPNRTRMLPVAVEDTDFLPSPGGMRLEPSFPNPFNPRTTISYWLSRATRVRLAVYDTRGRHITTLVDATMPSGAHAMHWDGIDARGRKLASGVYHIRAEAGSERSSQSIVLMK